MDLTVSIVSLVVRKVMLCKLIAMKSRLRLSIYRQQQIHKYSFTPADAAVELCVKITMSIQFKSNVSNQICDVQRKGT